MATKNQVDSTSDTTTDILDTGSDSSSIVVQNDLSIVKEHYKISLSTKMTIPNSSNILTSHTCLIQPWMEFAEKLLSK